MKRDTVSSRTLDDVAEWRWASEHDNEEPPLWSGSPCTSALSLGTLRLWRCFLWTKEWVSWKKRIKLNFPPLFYHFSQCPRVGGKNYLFFVTETKISCVFFAGQREMFCPRRVSRLPGFSALHSGDCTRELPQSSYQIFHLFFLCSGRAPKNPLPLVSVSFVPGRGQ